jgi:hypothetical protein
MGMNCLKVHDITVYCRQPDAMNSCSMCIVILKQLSAVDGAQEMEWKKCSLKSEVECPLCAYSFQGNVTTCHTVQVFTRVNDVLYRRSCSLL